MREIFTVSIIVPVYNVRQYLCQCVRSLIEQTYEKIEIILVDDGSTDGSGEICDDFAEQDNRIKVIHKSNGGLSSSRETGINAASGDYIMIVDGDDWIELNTIESCINIIDDNISVDCVLFSYVKEFQGSSVPMHVMDKDIVLTSSEAEDKVYRRLFGLSAEEMEHPERMDNIVSCCMKLYKADVARKGRYFDNRLVGSSEDTLFNMYALYKCGTIVYVDECFYHYRKLNTSLTNAYRAELDKKWSVLFRTMESIIDEKHLSQKYKDALGNRIALSIIGIGMNELGNKKVNCFKRYKKIRAYLRTSNYQASCKTLPIQHMPAIWKLFFVCCKMKMSVLVFVMLLGMMQLRKCG